MMHFFLTLQALIADRLERDDKGATLVEYGLLVGLIAVVCIAAVTALGTSIDGLFDAIATRLGTVATSVN